MIGTSKQMPIGFTKRHREMIEEIQDGEDLYPTITSVVQRAVIEMHERVCGKEEKHEDN